MSVEFIFKKTKDLSSQDIYDLNNLYNNIFRKKSKKLRDTNEFLNKFTSNSFGYSFHGIIKKDNFFIASYNVIPQEYCFFSKTLFFGLSVDTGVHENYRGNIIFLKRLAEGTYNLLKINNIVLVYGLPNNNIYLVRKKILKWKDIGRLNYYIYPVSLKKYLYLFSYLDFFLTNIIKFIIFFKEINRNNLNKNIYINFGNKLSDYNNLNHFSIKNINFNCVYKFSENKKNVYIVNIYPLTYNNIKNAIKSILRIEKDINLIIYPSSLKINQMIKIPNFFIRENNIISGRIISENSLQDLIWNIHNWNLSLSNFDN